MKTPYSNIYSVLKLNRFIVLSVVLVAFASSSYSIYQMYRTTQTMLNSNFAVDADGEVIPLKLVKQRENLAVEAKAHIALFHHYFYNLNTSNYQAQLEKALWLGDKTVDDVYRQKKADGIYNRILQYALVQKINLKKIDVDLRQEPYVFHVVAKLEVQRGTITDSYELVTSGALVPVDRNFPRNPHGLLITNFFENSLKKQIHEN